MPDAALLAASFSRYLRYLRCLTASAVGFCCSSAIVFNSVGR
jgi:hypothetical protein